MDNKRLEMAHPNAQTIKVGDIASNVPSIVLHDKSFAKVYLPEKHEQLLFLTKAAPVLRARTISVVVKLREQLLAN